MKKSKSRITIQNQKFPGLVYSFTFLILNFAFLCGCQQQVIYRDSYVVMGTFLNVSSPDKRSGEIVFREVKRIDSLLSKYIPESEISRLNKAGELAVSPDTMFILKKSREFYDATGGAFDITVAPLVDLWGFTDKDFRVPSSRQIKDALNLVGMDKIIFNDENNVVKFKLPGMKVDLGAIAKGYAVDCAVGKLKDAGIKSCVVNLGGQIYALGDRFGRPWRIAIRNPRSRAFIGYLNLKDLAVSTSGDYEQYFLRGNKRYSHIINPKTGYPADSGILSVTVAAASGSAADALSTSIFVLGKNKIGDLAKKFSAASVKVVSGK